MRCWHVLGGHLGFALLPVALVSGQPRPPIIDMHLHPGPGGDARGALDSTAVENYLGALRREYQAHNIVLGVLSGPTELVARWRRSAPDLFIGAPIFPCDQGIAPNGYTLRCLPDGHAWPDIKWLRGEYEATRFGAMGEILAQLAGVAPNDPRLEPYFALAEELDIPVGIHLGPNLPGAAYSGSCGQAACSPNYRLQAGSPLLLEDVLLRHPTLRLYVMHAGWPLLDEMIQLLWAHPQLYVDLAWINYVVPRPEFHAYLKRLMDAGFGKRIMYGSDTEPSQLGAGIASIDAAPFLTLAQKRDIFYNNAARFLKRQPTPLSR